MDEIEVVNAEEKQHRRMTVQPLRVAQGIVPAGIEVRQFADLPAADRLVCRSMPGSKRRMCPTCKVTPASAQAAMIRSQPATLRASGFSTNTCFPACAAATATSTCRSSVVQMLTADTSSRPNSA